MKTGKQENKREKTEETAEKKEAHAHLSPMQK